MFLNEEICSVESPLAIMNLLHKTAKEDLKRELIAGLTSSHKYISSKFFYDETGSKLFEKITHLPEYYLTRTEKSILKKVASKLGSELKDMDIIELGSGDCSKISILLEAIPVKSIEMVRYIPVDVSRTAIEESADILLDNFSGLEILGMVADFTKHLRFIPARAKRLFCFFGSTIGNLSREQAVQFFSRLSEIMQPEDRFLLGVDRVKSKDILEKAYNDSRDVTAKFNRNILNVVNSRIDTDFKTDDFEHVAFYNQAHSRIEMHLKALKDIEISSPYLGEKIIIEQGETIHTENSYKFTERTVEEFAGDSGLEIKKVFTDKNGWFSVIDLYKKGKNSP